MSLRETREDLIERLEEHLSVAAGGYPATELGETFEEAASCFQALGCCNLLLSMDVEGFHRNLILAGFARRRFLQRSALEKSTDFHLARSRCSSFFGAIAAGDLALAQEIGDLSPAAWVPDGEYEEDFAYYRLVHLVLSGGNEGARAPLLEQFESALEGATSHRLELCKAIHAADAGAFESTFVALLDARAEQVERERRLFEDDLTFAPASHVFVEGLALLRLAERLGLGPARRKYPQCPHAARAAVLRARPADIFDEIEKAVRS